MPIATNLISQTLIESGLVLPKKISSTLSLGGGNTSGSASFVSIEDDRERFIAPTSDDSNNNSFDDAKSEPEKEN